MDKTKVIFRKFQEGDIIALFPEIQADYAGNIQSYQHIGQHGAANRELLNDLEIAIESEYKDLYNELKVIGYDLEIVYTIKDVLYAEFLLEPLICVYCGSTEVVHNQLVNDAFCEYCGEWQTQD